MKPHNKYHYYQFTYIVKVITAKKLTKVTFKNKVPLNENSISYIIPQHLNKTKQQRKAKTNKPTKSFTLADLLSLCISVGTSSQIFGPT